MSTDATPREVGSNDGLGPLPERWYMVDREGVAMLCKDREDAEKEAAAAWALYPHRATYRAVLLGDVAAERDLQRNVREVFARWMAEACGVLFEVEEDAEDGGESLRMLRERGLRLVRAVLHPQPGEPWLEDEGPNQELTRSKGVGSNDR